MKSNLNSRSFGEKISAAVVVLFLSLGAAKAQDVLSEEQARQKAASILKGDPYGASLEEALRTIKQARLVKDGTTQGCDAAALPAWEFHVVAVTPSKDAYNNGVIDGYLVLDARSGELVCANLPQLN